MVEISLTVTDESAFVRATDAAFSRLEAIHNAMSFHAPDSDLSRIANAKRGEVLAIAADTWNTLALALDIEARSNGIFNPTVAPELVRRGLLPRPMTPSGSFNGTSNHIVGRVGVQKLNAQRLHSECLPVPPIQSLHSSIALAGNDRLRLQAPVWIDLGGIAKGYAVDQAIKVLRGFTTAGDATSGLVSGIVNAGGDLAVFGDLEHVVSVRVPSAPHLAMPVAAIRELSCATTATYFLNTANNAEVRSHSIEKPSHLVDVRRSTQGNVKFESVSVFAPCCAVADALTKVVWLGDPNSIEIHDILQHYQASAALINAAGEVMRR